MPFLISSSGGGNSCAAAICRGRRWEGGGTHNGSSTLVIRRGSITAASGRKMKFAGNTRASHWITTDRRGVGARRMLRRYAFKNRLDCMPELEWLRRDGRSDLAAPEERICQGCGPARTSSLASFDFWTQLGINRTRSRPWNFQPLTRFDWSVRRS